jgi:hypothetical protein
MAIEHPAGVDAAIDRAAREMTAATAPDDLRARVRQRIEARRWAGATFGWRALTTAAVVAIVAAVLMSPMWRGRTPSEDRATAALDRRTAVAPAPQEAVGVEKPAPAPAIELAASRRAAPPVVSATRQVAARTLPPSTIDVEPVAIAPIATEALELEDVPVPEDIEIEPIGITPLAVASGFDMQVE